MNKLNQNQLDDLTAEMNNYMAESGRKRFPTAKIDELATYGTKRCSVCTSVKLVEDFPKNSRKRDGLDGKCKACNCANTADHRKHNPEYMRKYREENRERLIEYYREYNAANREHYREYRRKHYQQHHERINEHKREYFRTRYRNDEIFRLQDQLTQGYYRAVRAGNTAEWITAEELLTCWAAKDIDPLECYLTGESLSPFDRSIDHVVAISNGGTHTVDNLMPCTLEANVKKNTLTPEEALERLNQ